MHDTYKWSLLAVLATIFLLPIFFLPASILPLGVAKTALISFGALVGFIAFALKVISRGGFSLPSTHLMWFTILIPGAYLLSALLTQVQSKSLFGYSLETGTAIFVLLGFVLMCLSANIFTDTAKIFRALLATLLGFSLLAIFALLKILTNGAFPEFGTFFGNMANPLGAWPDYALGFGLLSLFLALGLGVLPMKRSLKILVSTLFVVALFLMTVINFSSAFLISLVLGVVLFAYLKKADLSPEEGMEKRVVWPSALLALVSLVFLINPVVSGTYGTLGDTLSGLFNVANVEVRPSLSATLEITRAVLVENPVLGSGPDTFAKSWFLYKPLEINESVFWNTTFPAGISFMVTQVANVGILGALLWFAFFAILLNLVARSLARIPEERGEKLVYLGTLFGMLFLWLSAFFYAPGPALLTLAFIFTGLFLASLQTSRIIGTRDFLFAKNGALNFVSVILAVALSVGALALGFDLFQRTLANVNFQQALTLAGTEGATVDQIEGKLLSALRLAEQDVYYSAFSELSIARAESVLNSEPVNQEESLSAFQQALSNAIASAQSAVQLDGESYRNWVVLGNIYASLAPAPFNVEDAYESALEAYRQAGLKSPRNPEVPLLLARLEFNRSANDQARTHLEESLALKNDFVDAYLLLTQLEIRENNISGAIRNAEASAVLSPSNAGVFFQLGLLKYSAEDFTGALSAFEQALRLVPEYANAKYFLALSLERLGRDEEALLRFEDLAESNPDNEEVETIIENLRAGRDPLFGLPSADVSLRENPPIQNADNQ